MSEPHILRVAERAAARAGDRRPSLIQHAEGTRATANRVDSGEGVPGCRWSYLIAERGHFVLRNSEGLGTRPPRGAVLTLVVDAASASATDDGLSNRYPDLARLGRVTTDFRSPDASRRAGGRWCPKLAVLTAKRRSRKAPTSRWVWAVNGRYQRELIRDCPGVVSVGVSRAAVVRAEQQNKPLPPPGKLGQSVIAVGVKSKKDLPTSRVFLKGVPLLFQVTPKPVVDIGTTRRHSILSEGTLSGVLMVCCNLTGITPAGGFTGSTLVAGTISIKRVGGAARLLTADHTGHFSVALPAGLYEAVAGIPSLDWKLGQCHPARPSSASPPASPVIIRPDATTRVWIDCQGH